MAYSAEKSLLTHGKKAQFLGFRKRTKKNPRGFWCRNIKALKQLSNVVPDAVLRVSSISKLPSQALLRMGSATMPSCGSGK